MKESAGGFCGAALLLAAALLGACGPSTDPSWMGGKNREALSAVPPGDGDSPAVDCIGSATASLSASPTSIALWQTTTITWNVQGGCPLMKLNLAGLAVARQGSRVFQPIANTSYTLTAILGTARRTLATVNVLVRLPPVVTISSNSWVPMFVQALKSDDTKIIQIVNGVELDLSGWAFLPIKAGVSLLGGRTSRDPGARLYTTTHPPVLFDIKGDGARISGLRIQGPDTEFGECTVHDSAGIALDTDPAGAFVLGSGRTSMAQVLIDNNELSGWSGAAVRVHDYGNLIDQASGSTRFVVRGNYIHNNQRQTEGDCSGDTDGYGVDVSHGAYALIEQNVFDWNRHDIASDGSDGAGYFAYGNLVLEHGGPTDVVLGVSFHTHAFDMHGQNNCFPSGDHTWNCGPAGEYMDIRNNTFLYTEGYSFKLRGTPRASTATPGLRVGADVTSNVFARVVLFDNGVFQGALLQSETGLTAWDNRVAMNLSPSYGNCDFDGDGVPDTFFATGETWWFSSAGTHPWTYLNTSKLLLSQVSLGDFDHDGFCDVLGGGVLYSRGRSR
jgi:hypothetical protein